MTILDASSIGSWHAHVYFDAASRDAAMALRERIVAQFGDRVSMGR
ncbi:MAG TPA: DOPA 4,5-dioxygenase family protein, partial [Casimicrobiaceae bacterium]